MKDELSTVRSETGDDLHPSPSSEKDRQNSLFNILRGYEEFMLDLSGKIISSNLEAITITGYEEWEIMGRDFSMFYTKGDIETNQPERDLKRLEIEDHFVVSAWRVKKRNTSFWAKVKFYSVKNALGATCAYRMILQDATHKALYNFRVSRIKDEYLNLFSNAFIGIFKFGMDDFDIQLFNDKASVITGYKFTPKLRFDQLFTNRNVFENLIRQLAEKRRIQGFEFQINKPDGSVAWGALSCRYFANQNFTEGILIDITDRKTQVLELQRLNSELDKFIYHSSHDLRAPLTTMMGLLNLVNLAKPNKLVRQYASMLEERVGYMDYLLKDLASISFNNQTPPKVDLMDLDLEIKSVLDEFTASLRNINVSREINGIVSFYSDVFRIKTILRNLISNSIKFNNVDNPMHVLIIKADVEANKLMLTIEDNGRGIDENHLLQVFEMFFRGDDKANGTGLGLYVVKAMLNKLGGSIQVRSSKGVGTKFILEIPNMRS